MVGLQYLTTSLETLADPENPESESEGWLLEKSVKETVADFIATIKGLAGAGNQVGEGEEAVATVS
jgi:peripherin-2